MKPRVSIEERTDHNGNVFNSIEEMSRHYGIDGSLYRHRRKKGWSLEAALTTPVIKTEQESRTDHTGRVFESKTEMCRHWGISVSTYSNRIRSGCTKEDALTMEVLQNPEALRTDADGRVYDTIQKMCEYHGVKRSVYVNRMRHGVDKLNALSDKSRNKCSIELRTDHLGNVYDSIEAMCRFYRIHCRTYRKRIESGMTKERALTLKVKNHSVDKSIEARTDHKGNVYDSVHDMCIAYGIVQSTYWGRLKRGYSKEEALTVPAVRRAASEESRTDHKGKLYKNVDAMCSAYGLSRSLYAARRRKGMTKEEALTTPHEAQVSDKENRTDHNGRVYRSLYEMCRTYGIRKTTYMSRLESGYTKKDALTIPVKDIEKLREDVDGTECSSIKELCEKHNIKVRTYYSKLKQGYSKNDILNGKV